MTQALVLDILSFVVNGVTTVTSHLKDSIPRDVWLDHGSPVSAATAELVMEENE